MKQRKWLAGLLAGFLSHVCYASLTIPMVLIDEKNQETSIGSVIADDTIYGLMLRPALHGLPPGVHGFHIHEAPFCSNHAMGAGGHMDPVRTGRHAGPYRGNGHLGDLPVLIVDADGRSRLPVLAPRLRVSSITGHALMIHAGGDNYADEPEKLGGGGARIACGVIPDY